MLLGSSKVDVLLKSVDLVNDEFMEMSSWPRAVCLKVSFFVEY